MAQETDAGDYMVTYSMLMNGSEEDRKSVNSAIQQVGAASLHGHEYVWRVKSDFRTAHAVKNEIVKNLRNDRWGKGLGRIVVDFYIARIAVDDVSSGPAEVA